MTTQVDDDTQPMRVLTPRRRDLWQSLAEDDGRALGIAAPPPTDTHAQRHRLSVRRQVLQGAPVAAIARRRRSPTAGTGTTRAALRFDDQAVFSGDDGT